MKKFLFHWGGHSMPSSVGLLMIRIAAGGVLVYYHGWAKISSYSKLVEDFQDPLGLGSQWSLIAAIAAEVGCSILLILGLMTRWASAGVVFTMAVISFLVHKATISEIELPMIYLLMALALIFLGAGRISLDAAIYRGSGKK